LFFNTFFEAGAILKPVFTVFTSKSVVVPILGKVAGNTVVSIEERHGSWTVTVGGFGVINLVVGTDFLAGQTSVFVLDEEGVGGTGCAFSVIKEGSFIGTIHTSLFVGVIVFEIGTGFAGQVVMVPIFGKVARNAFFSIEEGSSGSADTFVRCWVIDEGFRTVFFVG